MGAHQDPISTDGVSIDVTETARQAKKNVNRTEDGIPIHACGQVSIRECPCWTCVKENCAACFASLI